jgi:hypothetical protein
MGKAYSDRLDERVGGRGRPVAKIDSGRKSKAVGSLVLRCGREKRPPRDRQINSKISSMVEKYDMSWKLSFAGGYPGIPRATHSIHSPGGHDTKTRTGHKGDSVSSLNACRKGSMVGNARFTELFHEFASQHITLNWLETHNTAYFLDGDIIDTGSREVKVSHNG